ncbi:MAG: phosphodiesterase [Magnetococcales bacterium]|nr:phosphodiesterase [Magnetococcales bacterium]
MVRLIQISDCHLFSDPKGQALQHVTLKSLNQVVDTVRINNPRPRMIVVTGDLSEDGSADSYLHLNSALIPMGVPVYAMPGNHDNTRVMREKLRGAPVRWVRSVSASNWNMVFLDSKDADQDSCGLLSDNELSALETALKERVNQPAIIFLHHHPVEIDSPWLDKIKLANSDALFDVIDRYPQVKAVVFGHIHQEHDSKRGSVRLLGTPSTSNQFASEGETMSLSGLQPGYRWFELQDDGGFNTGVVHIPSPE